MSKTSTQDRGLPSSTTPTFNSAHGFTALPAVAQGLAANLFPHVKSDCRNVIGRNATRVVHSSIYWMTGESGSRLSYIFFYTGFTKWVSIYSAYPIIQKYLGSIYPGKTVFHFLDGFTFFLCCFIDIPVKQFSPIAHSVVAAHYVLHTTSTIGTSLLPRKDFVLNYRQ